QGRRPSGPIGDVSIAQARDRLSREGGSHLQHPRRNVVATPPQDVVDTPVELPGALAVHPGLVAVVRRTKLGEAFLSHRALLPYHRSSCPMLDDIYIAVTQPERRERE